MCHLFVGLDIELQLSFVQIATYLQSQPTGFRQLSDAFGTLHRINALRGPNSGSRTLICRLCAAEVFFWGLRDWWIRERQKGFLEPDITGRPDCPSGDACVHQKDPGAIYHLY